jgi:hypothetical protein
MRGFSGDDLAQANTGTAAVVTSTSVTVPNGTAEGNAGIICLLAQAIIAAPSQWDLVANPSPGFGIAIMCRSDLPAGETSWPFSTAAGACNWAWTAGEWSNTAPAPLESLAPGGFSSAPASQSTGSTGTFSAQYVMGVAAFGIIAGSAGGPAWPSVAFSGGFTLTDTVQVGDGTGAADLYLAVARQYGADSDTGPWSCTATFTGSMTGKTAYAELAVFRAEETADPPMPVMTS